MEKLSNVALLFRLKNCLWHCFNAAVKTWMVTLIILTLTSAGCTLNKRIVI